MGIRCADHVTPLYPQKLALISPTGGGRSVGIVRSRTKATEFFICFPNDASSYFLAKLFKCTKFCDELSIPKLLPLFRRSLQPPPSGYAGFCFDYTEYGGNSVLRNTRIELKFNATWYLKRLWPSLARLGRRNVVNEIFNWFYFSILTVVILVCFLNYIKYIWQSNTPIYS